MIPGESNLKEANKFEISVDQLWTLKNTFIMALPIFKLNFSELFRLLYTKKKNILDTCAQVHASKL